MKEQSISQKFDQFQNDAVSAIVDDFKEKTNGRFLLVVPTGGGKTFTAVRAINSLFDSGILNPQKDKVAWVAHRKELLEQAKNTFERYAESEYYNSYSYTDQINFLMLSQAKKVFSDNNGYSLAIIDEAHHGAAPSYAPMFKKDDLAILGLTATPSRYDGEPLDFDRESYSIGFPDLIEIGVILRPEIVTVQGGHYEDIDDLSDDSLNILIDPERDTRIINALLSGVDKYNK
ncbi:DEAD/DEAH box helicase family protein, partial [bacterium]|nr:DEAD/DEAH box helicase family protein [bacterium]